MGVRDYGRTTGELFLRAISIGSADGVRCGVHWGRINDDIGVDSCGRIALAVYEIPLLCRHRHYHVQANKAFAHYRS